MSMTSFVATLVAPRGTKLSTTQIDTVAHSCGTVEKIVFRDGGQAADIFFIGLPGFAPAPKDFDVIVQRAATRCKKILIADMESTIIEQEMLDELASMIGVGDEVYAITRRAMNGELDFVEALRARVSLLKGHPEAILHEAASRMTLMPGAEALIAAMKATGAKTWLVSGGFTFFVKIIAERIGFDRYYSNELIVENGIITGEIGLPILDKAAKKHLLEKACADYGCGLSEALAVGDGANDILMLQACANGGGLGVAFHAKPVVQEVIHSQINHTDLSTLVYAQNL